MSQALPREWFAASIRNDGLRREKVLFRPRSVLAYLAVVALPLLALLFYIWQGVQVIRIGYEIDQLRRAHLNLQAERGRLEVELASLENLAAVETLALRDLGMVYPGPDQIVVVREEKPPAAPEAPPLPGGGETAEKSRLLVFLRKVTKAM